MEDFSVREMAKLAIWYDTTGSIVQTQRRFATKFQEKNRKPGRKFIEGCHRRLLEKGSVLQGKRGPITGQVRPVRTQSTEERVMTAFEQSPEKSW